MTDVPTISSDFLPMETSGEFCDDVSNCVDKRTTDFMAKRISNSSSNMISMVERNNIIEQELRSDNLEASSSLKVEEFKQKFNTIKKEFLSEIEFIINEIFLDDTKENIELHTQLLKCFGDNNEDYEFCPKKFQAIADRIYSKLIKRNDALWTQYNKIITDEELLKKKKTENEEVKEKYYTEKKDLEEKKKAYKLNQDKLDVIMRDIKILEENYMQQEKIYKKSKEEYDKNVKIIKEKEEKSKAIEAELSKLQEKYEAKEKYMDLDESTYSRKLDVLTKLATKMNKEIYEINSEITFYENLQKQQELKLSQYQDVIEETACAVKSQDSPENATLEENKDDETKKCNFLCGDVIPSLEAALVVAVLMFLVCYFLVRDNNNTF